MEASARSTPKPSFQPVNVPHDALTHAPVSEYTLKKNDSNKSTYVSPRLSPDGVSDVLEDIPPKPAVHHGIDDEMTDAEDMITVYTGKR